MPDPAKSGLSGDIAARPCTLHEHLRHFHASLTDRRPLGVAVSGGSDSLGLLIGLSAVMRPEKLVALTVDHGLRSGSADEARRVKARCRQLGIRHETLTWDAGRPVTGLQAAARSARYRLLADACGRHALSAVVTAHTRDDQNETLVMRQARSASDDAPGLAGIPPATLFDGRMWVLRPLLGCARDEIRRFLSGAGAADWIEDPSNQDPRFERVRVRAQLANQPQLSASETDIARIAAGRFRTGREAARLIAGRCHADASGLVHMRWVEGDPTGAVIAALEALTDWCGGAARPLDRRGKATLADLVAGVSGGQEGRVTLGRVLIRRVNDHFILRRENRDIRPLVLAPQESGVWDRRFEVRNLSRDTELTVAGGGEHGIMPCFGRDHGAYRPVMGAEEGVPGGYVCRPLAGRASRILPVYGLPVAQAVARLAGLRPFAACPWPAAMNETGAAAAGAE